MAEEKTYYSNVLTLIQEQILAGNNDYAVISSLFGDLYYFVDSEGENLLHYSCRRGDHDMVQWLISYGFYVDSQNVYGESPLMMTIQNNHEQVAKVLLRANATVELTDYCGQSILNKIAVGFLEGSIIPVALLLKLLKNCETVIEAAKKLYEVGCPLNVAMLLKNSKITEWLLQHGIRDAAGHDQPPALHVSVYYNDSKSVEILLNYYHINTTDAHGGGPLMYVRESKYCGDEHLIILKNLLKRSASFMTTYGASNFTNMQIHRILQFCSKETVRLVLEKNLDLCMKNGDGNTPLHILTRNKHSGIDELLKPFNFKVEARNYNNLSILESAASVNNTKIVQMLLDKNAKVNSQNGYGYTPLFFALICDTKELQDVECVELLIKYRAEIQIVTHLGKTLFDVVLQYRTFNLIQPVLAHLAKLEAIGTTIKDEITMKIKSDNRLEKPYDLYKGQIEKLKNTVVYDSVTMFKLLTESEEKVLMYLRNSQLVSNFRNIAYKKEQETFFHKEIKNKIENGLRKVHLLQRASNVLGDIVQFTYNSHPMVMDKMLSYLKEQDLQYLTEMEKLTIEAK